MLIKIFMMSAVTAAEKSLLTEFGQGVLSELTRTCPTSQVQKDWLKIGRWADSAPQNRVEFVYDDHYSTCDVAVIFGSWKPRDKGSHLCRTSVALNAPKFIVIETPLINRKTQGSNSHWRVGINGYLANSAYWVELSQRDADVRLTRWNAKWVGWRSNADGPVVLALQLPGDASLRGTDINDWAFDAILKIRSVTDKTIVVRNHPLCSSRGFQEHESLLSKLCREGVTNLKFSDGSSVPWSQDLEGAHCSVTYTSGLAIDSILQGIPTIACDPGNFAWGISSNDPLEVVSPKMPNNETITKWLRQLAGCQYSVEEFRNGTCWKHLCTVLEKI